MYIGYIAVLSFELSIYLKIKCNQRRLIPPIDCINLLETFKTLNTHLKFTDFNSTTNQL